MHHGHRAQHCLSASRRATASSTITVPKVCKKLDPGGEGIIIPDPLPPRAAQVMLSHFSQPILPSAALSSAAADNSEGHESFHVMAV